METNGFYIVCVYIAADGKEAMKDFFASISNHKNLVFMITAHDAVSIEYIAREIYQVNSSLVLVQANASEQLNADTFYLLPQNKTLIINETGFEAVSEEDPLNRIDLFFESLAVHFKEKVIAISLGDRNADNTKGIIAVKEEAGIVIFSRKKRMILDEPQDYTSGIHSLADYILSPSHIFSTVLNYISKPGIASLDKFTQGIVNQQELVDGIIELLSNYSYVNFKNYKVNSLFRRIEKRAKINEKETLQDYYDFIKENPEELNTLFNEYLIGVTSFFRNKEAFDVLAEKIIPNICANRKSFNPVRIWISACSTGEEAYSMAMLFDEHIKKNSLDLDFKIFATDLDKAAIDFAGVGEYYNIGKEVSKERIRTYFTQRDNLYIINKELRSKIVFAKHNILKDPPFINQDLISCRNLFIYLKNPAQKKLLHHFHFALKPEGYLLLGANESLDELKIFEPVNPKWKIFKNKPGKQPLPITFETDVDRMDSTRSIHPKFSHLQGKTQSNMQHNYFEEVLIHKFTPPCIFLDQDNDIIYSNGNLDRFLQLPVKNKKLNLFNMIDVNLASIFRNAIRKVSKEDIEVTYTKVPFTKNEVTFEADLKISGIRDRDKKLKSVMITFEEIVERKEVEKKAIVEEFTTQVYTAGQIEDLEMELRIAKEELQFTLQELEVTNEELQSSNEELLSANEELQGTNEELQSSNEELYTLNNVLQDKINELTLVNNDINNLLSSTEIDTIFLDNKLNIRKFTPAVKKHFNVLDTDLGRPINHLTHNFYDYEDFFADAQQVLYQAKGIEKEIRHRNGEYYLLRLLPYKTSDLQSGGVVITLINISELKKNYLDIFNLTEILQKKSDDLEESSQHLNSLINNLPDIVARFDKQKHCIYVSPSLRNVINIQDEKNDPERNILDLCNYLGSNLSLELETVLNKNQKVEAEFTKKIDDGIKYFLAKLIPEYSVTGNLDTVLAIITDVTNLKTTQLELNEKVIELKKINEYLDDFVHAAAHDLRAPVANLQLLISEFDKLDGHDKTVAIEFISKSIEKLDATISGLVRIIEIMSHKGEDHKEIAFKNIVADLLPDLKDGIKKANGMIIENYDEAPTIKYFEPFIISILKNLLSNSVKYYQPGRDLKISISTYRAHDEVILIVTDNGIGMDMEKGDKKIFQPFARFTRTQEGLGLGLHLIKSMIEKNGGRIQIQSQFGIGTTVTAYLKEV